MNDLNFGIQPIITKGYTLEETPNEIQDKNLKN